MAPCLPVDPVYADPRDISVSGLRRFSERAAGIDALHHLRQMIAHVVAHALAIMAHEFDLVAREGSLTDRHRSFSTKR